MLYRLTFALNKEQIVTTEMISDKEDLVGATEEAMEQIEHEYGPQAALHLVAFSLLKLEDSGDV